MVAMGLPAPRLETLLVVHLFLVMGVMALVVLVTLLLARLVLFSLSGEHHALASD